MWTQEEEQQWKDMEMSLEQSRAVEGGYKWSELTRLDYQGFIMHARESEFHPDGEGNIKG